jgi:hypothetical protein
MRREARGERQEARGERDILTLVKCNMIEPCACRVRGRPARMTV